MFSELTLVASQEPVDGEYSVMDTVPSDEAAASRRPSSWGAHAMLLMEAVCSVPGRVRSAGASLGPHSIHSPVATGCPLPPSTR
eukprot:1157565-Pelagomonas_calceolata.AAC.4